MEGSDKEKENTIYKEIIENYIIKNKKVYKIKDINNIVINFEKLGGGMNKNYLIKIENKENNKIYKFFFRYFNELVETFDRKKEVEIIKKLGEMGYGPKLLDFDYEKEKYIIDEYLDEAIDLPYEEIFNENILNELIIIINNYSRITDIYKYEIKEEDNLNYEIKIIQEGNNSFYTNKNIYDNLLNNTYYKAKKNFDKFNKDYNEYSIRDDKLNDINMNKIKYILNNFKNLFTIFFNKKGFFILNHHDLYRLNILKNKITNKIYIIDNEFSCLSLIGFDIIWYLLMSIFRYFPKYEYHPNLMNYDKFYIIYQKYLECFIKTNQEWINNKEERSKYIESLKNEKYFCELLCVANLFAILFGLLDLNFNKDSIIETCEPFYINVLNRIELFDFSYEKYKNIK